MKNKKSESPPKIVRLLFPTMDNVLWIGVFMTVLLRGWRMINADGDLPLHLAQGRFILDFGRVPLQDYFSHTLAMQPVVQHKWLGQVIFAFTERFFSLDGVVILVGIVIASTLWLVFQHIRGEGGNLFSTVFVIILAALMSMVHWLTRPHVFTFLFLAAWVIVLKQLRKGNLKLWWLLPALMVIWVNLHGGFIAGFVTWLFYGMGILWDSIWDRLKNGNAVPYRFWRYYLLAGASAFLSSLFNLSGFGLWHMIVRHLGSQYLASITNEFQPPDFHQFSFWPFLIMIGLLVVVMGLCSKKIETGDLLNVSVWLLFGLYSGRNIPLFGIVAAPLIVQGLDDIMGNAPARMKIFEKIKDIDKRLHHIELHLQGYFWPIFIFIIAVVGLSFGLRFDYEKLGYQFDPDVFPIMAVDWLEVNPQEGEMFNEFMWGGYLQYRLWPNKLVFIDPNADFYGEDFVREYIQVIYMDDGWENVLDKYDVDWAILPPDYRVTKAIQKELGWEVVYQDETAVILRR